MSNMELEDARNSNENDTESLLPSSSSETPKRLEYCCGRIQAEKVGNMLILFPERFHAGRTSWGVVGPMCPTGPLFVWGILCTASFFVIRKALDIGPITTVMCCAFYVISTFNLLNVVLRDPGICFYKEIPKHISPEDARDWMYNDRCNVYLPPGGKYCSQCDVCIEGYDHFCAWMGTTIGKKNMIQFQIFNAIWLIYLFYAYFWLVIGHLATKHSEEK
ncbi:unnamed protein product [Cylindrotheca closterium]|uniref:Palmitoyltransferase n=1 Tax=Cylindrotheca closterium TaxID=2856 RepID=A0AAD2CHI3_9STRA|nr:unnamed protein product [Cylindrotheca closterium]